MVLSLILLAVLIIIYLNKEMERSDRTTQYEREISYQNQINERKEKSLKEAERIHSELAILEKLKEKLRAIEQFVIPNVDDYIQIVQNSETIILSKGGDTALHSFIKINYFLTDFRDSIIKSKQFLLQLDDNELLTETSYHNIINSSSNIFEIKVKTLEWYKNISISMLLLYKNDKKIEYYKIFDCFERLGVFDSSWQKNVTKKITNIEESLSDINGSLMKVNNNFLRLVESNENIISELRNINSDIVTNNMLQALVAYRFGINSDIVRRNI